MTTTSLIEMPSRLAEALAQDKALEGYVYQAIDLLGPWLEASGMVFFPSFTDHGRAHLQRVMATADWLVTDETWGMLSPRSAACLVIGVLLHDSAMHLTADGFRTLVVSNGSRAPRFPDLDGQTWGALWTDYLLEAKHWSGERCAETLGPSWLSRPITDLPLFGKRDLEDLSESEHRFIGEFVRRHHTRLAHEFAVTGVPGAQQPLTLIFPTDAPALADLTGLVARSHGLDLRRTFPYLRRTHDGVRNVFGVEPVFLMGVLRIADYLDLHAERASPTLLMLKRLRSVVSEREWGAHAAIRDIRYGGSDDPERIEIMANPGSAQDYASVLRWVRGIQAELDQTWAVLGEVYGGHQITAKPALKLRRITSPLEDERQFAADKRLPFMPEPARFQVATRELLPMLARPLYGDHPEVGIRELLQNAIDAVSELDASTGLGGSRTELEKQLNEIPAAFGAEISISICERTEEWPAPATGVPAEWTHWVEVADRGVGMTPETVRSYFLCAGATLRRDIAWLRKFASDKGLSFVRSGRFGIGTLASFVLGAEIQVTTRHVSEPELGTSFRATMESDAIELRRVAAPLGTTVRVRLDEPTASALIEAQESWDWYCLDKPTIRRVIRRGSATEIKPQELVVAAAPDPTQTEWRQVACDGLDSVLWRPNGPWGHSHRLFCNGFRVLAWRKVDRPLLAPIPELRQPDVLVTDRNGLLPLTVTRNALQSAPPYAAAIRRDALLDHCAWLIDQASKSPGERRPFEAPMWDSDSSMGPGDGRVTGPSYLSTESGLVPLTAWHLRGAGLGAVTLFFTSVNLRRAASDGAPWNENPRRIAWELQVPELQGTVEVEPFGGFGRAALGSVAVPEFERYADRYVGRDAARCLLVNSRLGAELQREDPESWLVDERTGWYHHVRPTGSLDPAALCALLAGPAEHIRRSSAAVTGIARFQPLTKAVRADEFAEIWLELELPPAIPTDERRRREACAGAEKRLAAHLQRYRRSESAAT